MQELGYGGGEVLEEGRVEVVTVVMAIMMILMIIKINCDEI